MLHQLMPSVVTCLVAKRLGNRFADNHWELRDFSANLVASICKRFGHVYSNLQTRLTKTLLNAFLDPKRALTQQYGAIQGIAALGPNVVRILILPNLELYMRLLEPEMLLEKQKNEMKRYEAWRVYDALLRAAGQCIYDRLKIFPRLPSPPALAVLRTNTRSLTAFAKPFPNHQDKRKGSMEHLEEQPPHKKIATDGPILAVSNNSSPSHMEGKAVVQAPLGDSNVDPSSSSGQTKEIILDGRGRRGMGDNIAPNAPAVLSQIWKNDLDSGRLLVVLFEFFGEGILPFIPAPEMSLFL
ncbi:Transcription initiation factor TFIID subunit 6 [Morella rubra]|uniref:Transcription initiation factor TFIID subunit 6 n=1 Tax=Morella rubra TaxID=262757 RepID=A0A6A1UJV7_9ROSI|nr:Transcription initiation factor TFIID subunit 6 [Morella rubra]